MRTTILSAILALSAVALSQSLTGLPTCAQSAALSGVQSSGCGQTDAECLCKSSGFIASLTSAIQTSCSGSDIQAACAWGNSACSSYGVSIPCSTASTDSTATTTSSTDTSSSMATAAAANTSDGGQTSMTAAPAGTDGNAIATSASNTMGSSATGSMTTGSGSSSLSSTFMTSMTSMASMTAMNGTLNQMSTMNSTRMTYTRTSVCSTTSMNSTTSSGPTSQYTGAASAAVHKRSGVVGAFAGMAFLFALF